MASSAQAATPYNFKSVQVRGGGFVPAILYHPLQANLVYARTDMGGAYRSDDGGLNWIPLTDFLNRDQADSMGNLGLALDPSDVNRVYLQCGKYTQSWAGNGTFLASSNQGATWTVSNLAFKVGGNEDGRGTGERLVVDPNLGSNLWMGSNNAGLWRSTNYGAAWTQVTAFTPTSVTFVLVDKASGSTGVASQTIYVGVNTAGSSVWRSINNGATWGLVPGSPAGQIARRAALQGTTLFLGFCDALGPNSTVATGATYKLNTGTLAWTAIPLPAGQGGTGGISVDPANANNLAAATMMRWWPADEVYRSTNGGSAWTATLAGAVWDESSAPWVASGNPHWISDVQMDPNNPNKALWVTGYGVYGTSNFQSTPVTWTFMSTGIEQAVPIQLISPPAGAPVLSAMGDIDGFKHDNLDSPSGRFQPEVGTTLAIAFAEAVPIKMVKGYNNPTPYGAYSVDGGANWTAFGTAPAGANGGGTRSIAISPNGTNIVWCPPGAACSYSVNNGGTWTACGGGIPAGLEPVADRSNSNKFYAVDGMTGQAWISTNGGQSFAVGATGLGTLPSYQLSDVSLKSTLGIDGDLWLCMGVNGLWHSTNSGANFTKLTNVTNAYEVSTGLSSGGPYPALYFFGTTGGVRGFYRSEDTGVTWVRINDNQHQYGWIHDFTGDPRVYGRLYFSAEGRGLFYGDIPSAGSPTFTATPTPSFSATITVSSTQTATPSASPTVSLTYTDVPPGSSATDTPTISPTFSASPTDSAMGSATLTASSTTTATPSATQSVTATWTETPLAMATFTATPSSGPGLAAAPPLAILQAWPWPNPNPSFLAVQLSSAADELTLKLWSSNMRLLAESKVTGLSAGWIQVPLPKEFMLTAANGSYYYSVSAVGLGRKTLPKAPGKLQVLR